MGKKKKKIYNSLKKIYDKFLVYASWFQVLSWATFIKSCNLISQLKNESAKNMG